MAKYLLRFIFAGQRGKEYLNDFLTYDVDADRVEVVTSESGPTRRLDEGLLSAAQSPSKMSDILPPHHECLLNAAQSPSKIFMLVCSISMSVGRSVWDFFPVPTLSAL